MTQTAAIVAITAFGVVATAVSFFVLYSGPQKPRRVGLVGAGAALVGASPFIALALGTSYQAWLRGLTVLGLIAFAIGLALVAIALLLSRRWIVLISAVPMAGLSLWSFILLAIFSTGAA